MIFSRIANRESRIERNAKGFTLVELLVVIVIIGIVSSVGAAAFVSTQKSGRDSRRKADLGQLKNALEMYYGRHHAYPSSLDYLVTNDEGVVYIKGIPKDPLTKEEYFYVKHQDLVDQGFAECFTLEAMLEIRVGESYRVFCP